MFGLLLLTALCSGLPWVEDGRAVDWCNAAGGVEVVILGEHSGLVDADQWAAVQVAQWRGCGKLVHEVEESGLLWFRCLFVPTEWPALAPKKPVLVLDDGTRIEAERWVALDSAMECELIPVRGWMTGEQWRTRSGKGLRTYVAFQAAGWSRDRVVAMEFAGGKRDDTEARK